MTEKKESLIDQLLVGAEKVIDAAKRPFVKKKISRVFESAADSLEEKITDASIAIQNLRAKLVEKPENAASVLDQIIEQRNIIDRAEKTKDFLAAEKKEMFS